MRWRAEPERDPLRPSFSAEAAIPFPALSRPRYPEAEGRCGRDRPGDHPGGTELPWDFSRFKIRSFNEDGRWFVMNSKEKGSYDFIFGDAFNDLSIPYHLTTKEFAMQMKEASQARWIASGQCDR